MPGKEIKLIRKTLHADGYYCYTATSEAASEAAATILTPKRPRIKISFRFDKAGLIIGSTEQRDIEKLIREEEEQEQAAAAVLAKEEIPTPGFVLLKKEEVEDDHHYTSSMASTLFQSKLDASKRKMHDSFQQLANAKKQRRIQVIDPRDLPPPPTDQSSSKGKGGAVPARKKMTISTTNRKTRNFFNGRGGQSKLLVKPTSIF